MKKSDVPILHSYFLFPLLGFWDSWRTGRGAKVPRCYTSEIFGWDPHDGARAAGRTDPNNIMTVGVRYQESNKGNFQVQENSTGKAPAGFKDDKPSNIGHGNIPPVPGTKGGVSISSAERLGFLSFAALHKLRFPSDDGSQSFERNVAARTVLACLALVGDRLAFRRPTVLLRSGCELVVMGETLAWLGAAGATDEFELDTAAALVALQIARDRAAVLGLSWETKNFDVEPQPRLRDLLAATFTRYVGEDD